MTNQELSTTIDKYFKFLKEEKNTSPIDVYLGSLADSGKRSMRSLLQSAANIIELEGELEQMPWPLLHYKHFAQIRSSLKDSGKSANTINLTLSACRGVMKACFNLGLIKADQFMSINEIKRVRGKKLPSGRCLSQQEIKSLIRICKRDKSITGKRDLAIIVLMLSTGIRRSEVISLNLEDYNTRSGQLIIIAGKGNKQRMNFVQTDSRKMIRPWVHCRGKETGSLFLVTNKNSVIDKKMTSQAIYDLLKKRSNEANIKNCRPHDLRRTFVTRLLESGVDINTVRQLAGHSDIQTTARYDLRDEKEQKRAIKRTLFVL